MLHQRQPCNLKTWYSFFVFGFKIPAKLITKTRLFKYIENLPTKKGNFQIKHSDIFHLSAQSIDCGYSLEPPR